MRYIEIPDAILSNWPWGDLRTAIHIGMYRELGFFPFSPFFFFFSVYRSELEVSSVSFFRGGPGNQLELHCDPGAIRALVFRWLWKAVKWGTCAQSTGKLFIVDGAISSTIMEMTRIEGSVNRILCFCVGWYFIRNT